jgi:Flp pilus assembly protein TadG
MLPVLLLLLVGLVEVGNALNAYLTVVDAARDGARLGSKGSLVSDDQIKALVVKETGRLPNAVNPASDVTVERQVLGLP